MEVNLSYSWSQPGAIYGRNVSGALWNVMYDVLLLACVQTHHPVHIHTCLIALYCMFFGGIAFTAIYPRGLPHNFAFLFLKPPQTKT